jgi:predicted PolB exonuclease-like 3'-5' exonuclease
MTARKVSYLVFDVESVADGDLIAKVRYPDENLSASDAIKKYTGELMEQFGTEFIPYTYHIPISVAAAKIGPDRKLDDIVTLDQPEYRPHEITKKFWDGWRVHNKPKIISFNGRTFDLPLMELSAYRFGISIPDWFNLYGKSWEQPRARYNPQFHLDLQDVLTNFGATRLNGGLNLAATLIGNPGKMGIAGHMVQQLYYDGEIDQINDYCRCDVLDTYFVFLRASVMIGEITIEQERELVKGTQDWLQDRATEFPVYQEYLDKFETWENPFQQPAVESKS